MESRETETGAIINTAHSKKEITVKSNAQRQKEYRNRKRIEKQLQSGKKIPKTNAQCQQHFRQKHKERLQQNEALNIVREITAKSNAQRQKEYRKRKKLENQLQSGKKIPKTNAECQQHFRQKQKEKLQQNEALNLVRKKKNAERAKRYRDKQKLKKQCAELDSALLSKEDSLQKILIENKRKSYHRHDTSCEESIFSQFPIQQSVNEEAQQGIDSSFPSFKAPYKEYDERLTPNALIHHEVGIAGDGKTDNTVAQRMRLYRQRKKGQAVTKYEPTNEVQSSSEYAKRIKLESEPQTGKETNWDETPVTCPKLSPHSELFDVPTDKLITAWSESIVSKLKEFDESTRIHLMKQIDDYIFCAKLQHIKSEDNSENIYEGPIRPLFVEVPTTSEYCKFELKKEKLDLPEDT